MDKNSLENLVNKLNTIIEYSAKKDQKLHSAVEDILELLDIDMECCVTIPSDSEAPYLIEIDKN